MFYKHERFLTRVLCCTGLARKKTLTYSISFTHAVHQLDLHTKQWWVTTTTMYAFTHTQSNPQLLSVEVN